MLLSTTTYPDCSCVLGNLRKVAKYVDVKLDLKEYHVMQIGEGEKHVLCKSLEQEVAPEPSIIPTKQGHLSRIEDDEVRELCIESLNQLESMGAEVRPKEYYWFSIWFKGKRFMNLGCKKKYFVCYVSRTDNLRSIVVRHRKGRHQSR